MHLKTAALMFLLLPLLAACAGGGAANTRAPVAVDDETVLSQRSIERWEHLIAKRADQAWEYLSPGYRSTRDREEYVSTMTHRPVTWLDVEPHSVECEQPGKFCAVALKLRFKVRSRQIGVGDIETESFLTERWIKVGDTWFHVPEDVSG